MKSLLKEPLFHFLAIGAALFAAYGFLSNSGAGDRGEILVSSRQVEALAAVFAKTWQRLPTSDELTGLISAHVREEVYAREAVAMGLDRDDAIIRRRLQQKLEFITNDLAVGEATDAELNAYLQAHPELFQEPAQFTFKQVYLNPEKHRGSMERDARQLLAQLNNASDKADPASKGDATMLEHSFVALRRGDVANTFGDEFAAQLEQLTRGQWPRDQWPRDQWPRDQWQGPIASGYGAHLVLVSERTEGRLPELSQVRDAVQREWANARRSATNEQFYQALLARYTVTIEDRAGGIEKTAASQ